METKKPKAIVVGFVGLAGAGKSTMAVQVEHVLPSYRPGVTVKPLSFAAPVKELSHFLIRTMARACGEEYWNTISKESGVRPGSTFTLRDMYVHIGTHIGRKIDPDVWVRILEHAILQRNEQVIIIDDVRFPNELRLCDIVVVVKTPHLKQDKRYPYLSAAAPGDPEHMASMMNLRECLQKGFGEEYLREQGARGEIIVVERGEYAYVADRVASVKAKQSEPWWLHDDDDAYEEHVELDLISYSTPLWADGSFGDPMCFIEDGEGHAWRRPTDWIDDLVLGGCDAE